MPIERYEEILLDQADHQALATFFQKMGLSILQKHGVLNPEGWYPVMGREGVITKFRKKLEPPQEAPQQEEPKASEEEEPKE